MDTLVHYADMLAAAISPVTAAFTPIRDSLSMTIKWVAREVADKHHRSLADAILTFSVTIGFGLIVVIYFLIKDRKEDAAIAVEEGKQSKTQRGSSDAVMLEAYRGEKDEGGQPHGMGEMEWGDGEAYKGNFVHGSREGEGMLFSPNGDVFSGAFKSDVPHGVGIYNYAASGSKEVSDWAQGEPVGEGARWDKARENAVRIVNGENPKGISLEDARGIALRLKTMQENRKKKSNKKNKLASKKS